MAEGEILDLTPLPPPPKKPPKKTTPPPPQQPIVEPSPRQAIPEEPPLRGENEPTTLPAITPKAPELFTARDAVTRLTEMEVQASIFRVAQLPAPFNHGIFKIPEGTVELCDAMVFIQNPTPVNVTIKFQKDGMPTIGRTMRMVAGWVKLPTPKGYVGGTAEVTTNRPIIAYRSKILDWGFDHSSLVRKLIGPATSDRRIHPIYRPNIRLEILPSDLQSISTHPDTREVWGAFLFMARKVPT